MEEEREKKEGIQSAAIKTATSEPRSEWEQIVASANPINEALTTSETSVDTPLEEMQLALSFRADLPLDIPPTMSSRCVRYFYSAVLVVTTAEGEVCVPSFTGLLLRSNNQYSYSLNFPYALLHSIFLLLATCHTFPFYRPCIQLAALFVPKISPNFHDASSRRRSPCHCPLGRSAGLHFIH